MVYPEMHYLYWWNGKPALVARFTPEKDLSGAYLIDKSERYEVLWSRSEELEDFFNRIAKNTPFARKQMTHDPHEFITWMFGKER